MDYLIYGLIFILILICTNAITIKKSNKQFKVKKPILVKNQNLKNKETYLLKKIYNLKNLEILFLDLNITKLKKFNYLILQDVSWKIMPNKLMFYVPKHIFNINNKIYSILLNYYNCISFTSDELFAKQKYISKKNVKYNFKIDNNFIYNLITFNKKTYAILNSHKYMIFASDLSKNLLIINLVSKDNHSTYFEFGLKLKKFDYYSISRLDNLIILKGEIYKDEYSIECNLDTNISTNGIYLFVKSFYSQIIIIHNNCKEDFNRLNSFNSNDGIVNRYYSYLNMNFLNLNKNIIDDFLEDLGIEINTKYIKIKKLNLDRDFWIDVDNYHINFIKDNKCSNIIFVLDNKKISGSNKLNLTLVQDKNLTILY